MSRKKKETTPATPATAAVRATPVAKPVFALPASMFTASMPRATSIGTIGAAAILAPSTPAATNGHANGHARGAGAVSEDDERDALREALRKEHAENEAMRAELEAHKKASAAAPATSPAAQPPAAVTPAAPAAPYAPSATENLTKWATRNSESIHAQWTKGRHGQTIPQHESHLCALWEWVLAPPPPHGDGLGAPAAACTLQIRATEGPPRPYDLEVPGEAVTHTDSQYNPRRAVMDYLNRNRKYPDRAEHMVGRIFARRADGGEQDLGTGDLWLPPVAATPPAPTPASPYAAIVPWQQQPGAPATPPGYPSPYWPGYPPPYGYPPGYPPPPYGYGAPPPWAHAGPPPEAVAKDPAMLELWKVLVQRDENVAKTNAEASRSESKFKDELLMKLLEGAGKSKNDGELDNFIKAIDVIDRIRGARETPERPISERIVDVGGGTKIFMDRKGDPDGPTSLGINIANGMTKIAERLASRGILSQNAAPAAMGGGGMPRAKG